jgi:hypothetical protein
MCTYCGVTGIGAMLSMMNKRFLSMAWLIIQRLGRLEVIYLVIIATLVKDPDSRHQS